MSHCRLALKNPYTLNLAVCFAPACNCQWSSGFVWSSCKWENASVHFLWLWWCQSQRKSNLFLEDTHWSVFITWAFDVLCNVPRSKVVPSNAALPQFPFGKDSFAITWAVKTSQMKSDEQCWATCEAVWVQLQGVLSFGFYWYREYQLFMLADRRCLVWFGLFFESNEVNEGTVEGWESGKVCDVPEPFQIVCILLL